MKRVLQMLACVLLTASAAQAQTSVINPTKIEFACSAEHNTTFLGADVVVSYKLTYKDGANVIASVDQGKPTLVNGLCTVAPPAAVVATKNKTITVYVEAIGAGSLISDPSDVSDIPFGWSAKPTRPGKPSPKP